MLYEKYTVFTTTQDICTMARLFDLPKVCHHTDWTIELYMKLLEYIQKNNISTENKPITEILVKLKCDVLNALTDFERFVSPSYSDNNFIYTVWDNNTNHHNNDLSGIKSTTPNIETYYNEHYRNKSDISVFDVVKFNKPSSKHHGSEMLVVGMAFEDGELLFKGYGVEGNMYGYCVYSEMEKLNDHS